MTVYRSIHEIIGHTPMVELTQFHMPSDVRLYAKLEYLNPGGSIKDRLGLELIDEAFRTGKLVKGGTLIEQLQEIQGLVWRWQRSTKVLM